MSIKIQSLGGAGVENGQLLISHVTNIKYLKLLYIIGSYLINQSF